MKETGSTIPAIASGDIIARAMTSKENEAPRLKGGADYS